MEKISSTKNALIKQIKKLCKKKAREEQGLYIIEGFHLIEEALKSDARIRTILVSPQAQLKFNELKLTTGISQFQVTTEVMASISSVPAPQGILALVELATQTIQPNLTGPVLLLDNVQDPGNVGTMIRTADAANFSAVILGRGCADIYNDKVIRSMQGSHFHLEIIQGDLINVIPELKSMDYQIFGTELNSAAVDYRDIQPTSQFGILMGNEGQGVSASLLQLTDKNLYIPIIGQAESLNVAVAAGILMFSLS